MGNQESKPEPESEQADEEQEPFDLDAIEDSREYIRSANPYDSSTAATSPVIGRKRNPEKRKEVKAREGAVKSMTTPSLLHDPQADDERLFARLREREPEQFDQYDSSSESDDEEVPQSVEKPRRRGKAPSQASLEDSEEGTEHGGCVASSEPESESDLPPQESDDDDLKPDDSEGAPSPWATEPDGAQSPVNGVASKPDAASDESDSNPSRLGPVRHPCPYAKEHDCTATFTTKKIALRHGKGHINPFICLVCKTKLARQDTLAKHMKRLHTAQEIAKAEANGLILDRLEEAAEETDDTEESRLKAGDDNPLSEQAFDDGGGPTERSILPLNDKYIQKVQRSAEPTRKSTTDREDDEIDVEQQKVVQNKEAQEDLPAKVSHKRKREEYSSSPTNSRKSSSRKKRKQKNETSPSEPGPVAEHTANAVPIATPSSKQKQVSKEPQALQRRQSSIDTWAQPYTKGSELRHPLFHPHSSGATRSATKIEVLIPVTKPPRAEQSEVDRIEGKVENVTARKRRKTQRTSLHEEVGLKEPANLEPLAPETEVTRVNGATSFAERMSSASGGNSMSRPQRESSEEAEDADGEHGEPTVSSTDSGFVCPICNSRLRNEKTLKSHMKKGTRHDNLLSCKDCDEKFAYIKDLGRHKKATGHGKPDGSLGGRFTEDEEAEMRLWIKQFCQIHDLTCPEFNEMMTASHEIGAEWRYKFITKAELKADFMSVLPHRSSKSMARYRDKHFTTAVTSKAWTQEEDDELIRLHEELGTAWSKIGKLIDRTGEQCRQRWKNKLQCRHMESGAWTKFEELLFVRAVNELRRASSGPSSPTFNWGAVSKAVKTRTPQQCSNHWRAKYGGVKQGDTWVSLAIAGTPAQDAQVPTPSKMEERLAGRLKSSPRTPKANSSQYVHASDDEEEQEDEDDGPDANSRTKEKGENPKVSNIEPSASDKRKSRRRSAKEESEEDDSVDVTRPPESDSEDEDQPDRDEEDQHPRNPLADITPGKTLGMSQIFNQTQANTSAKRLSPRRASEGPSQERPSPKIPIRHQRIRSPELGSQEADSQETDEDAEESDSKSDVDVEENKENVPQHDGQADGESDSEEENEAGTQDEVYVKNRLSEEATDEEASISESEQEEESTSTDADSESESESKLDTTGPSKQTLASKSPTSDTSSETDSDSGSASESESESESTSASISESEAFPRRTPPSNKKLAQISNDFMANVYETARKRRARRPVYKFPEDSSSDDDEDGGERQPSQVLPTVRRR